MARLLYQGHGSYRLTTTSGQVIYVDPFAGTGYEQPADLILITHGHHDHTKIELCNKKISCQIISHKEALANNHHNSFALGWAKIQAVEAGNKNHDPKECVGYIITIDGIKIYASGDTSKTATMKNLAALELDYALFCGDGIFNMDISEAAECARLVKAKHNILVHMSLGALFDRAKAEAFNAPSKLIVEPGQEIEL